MRLRRYAPAPTLPPTSNLEPVAAEEGEGEEVMNQPSSSSSLVLSSLSSSPPLQPVPHSLLPMGLLPSPSSVRMTRNMNSGTPPSSSSSSSSYPPMAQAPPQIPQHHQQLLLLEDADGVLLDRDQPLHSTPVLVPRPSPVMPLPMEQVGMAMGVMEVSPERNNRCTTLLASPPPATTTSTALSQSWFSSANNANNSNVRLGSHLTRTSSVPSTTALNEMMVSMIPSSLSSMLLPPTTLAHQQQEQQQQLLLRETPENQSNTTTTSNNITTNATTAAVVVGNDGSGGRIDPSKTNVVGTVPPAGKRKGEVEEEDHMATVAAASSYDDADDDDDSDDDAQQRLSMCTSEQYMEQASMEVRDLSSLLSQSSSSSSVSSMMVPPPKLSTTAATNSRSSSSRYALGHYPSPSSSPKPSPPAGAGALQPPQPLQDFSSTTTPPPSLRPSLSAVVSNDNRPSAAAMPLLYPVAISPSGIFGRRRPSNDDVIVVHNHHQYDHEEDHEQEHYHQQQQQFETDQKRQHSNHPLLPRDDDGDGNGHATTTTRGGNGGSAITPWLPEMVDAPPVCAPPFEKNSFLFMSNQNRHAPSDEESIIPPQQYEQQGPGKEHDVAPAVPQPPQTQQPSFLPPQEHDPNKAVKKNDSSNDEVRLPVEMIVASRPSDPTESGTSSSSTSTSSHMNHPSSPWTTRVTTTMAGTSSSFSSLGGGDYSDLLIRTEPQQVWELLQYRQVAVVGLEEEEEEKGGKVKDDNQPATDDENDDSNENLSFVRILHRLFAEWTSPAMTMTYIQRQWDHSCTATMTSGSFDGKNENDDDDEQPILYASNHSPPLALLCMGIPLDRPKATTSTTTTSSPLHGNSVSSSNNSLPSLPLLTMDKPPPPLIPSSKQQLRYEHHQQPEPPLFWQMPSPFLRAFLRILTRLITLESTEQYNQHISLSGSSSCQRRERRRRRPPRLFTSMEHEPLQPDIVYHVARLSSGWKQREDHDDGQRGRGLRKQSPLSSTTEVLEEEEDGEESQGRNRPTPRPSVLFCILSLVEWAMAFMEQNQHQQHPHHTVKQHTNGHRGNSTHNSPSRLYQHFSEVLPALIYLLGTWGVAGTTPLVLRRWVALIHSSTTPTTTTSHPTLLPTAAVVFFRDALVRALTRATHYSSLVTPPRCFFTFQLPPKQSSTTSPAVALSRRSPSAPDGGTARSRNARNTNNNATPVLPAGLKRSIRGLTTWPFRNDFGMATWFRLEHAQQRVRLLSVRTDRGAGWTIALQPLAAATAPSSPSSLLYSGAYTIVVSVYDSGHTSPSHQLTVSGCVLVPRNWYHIAIRHTRSRLKGVFSLSTRQQLVLLLDGKIMVNQQLAFPRVENRLSSSGGQESSMMTTATSALLLRPSAASQSNSSNIASSSLNLEIEAAAHLEGQLGTLYLFRENVSDAAFRGIYEATGGKDRRTSAIRRLSTSSVMMIPPPPLGGFGGGSTGSSSTGTNMTSLDSNKSHPSIYKSRTGDHAKKEEALLDSVLLMGGISRTHSSSITNTHHQHRRPSLLATTPKSNRHSLTLDFQDPDLPEVEMAGIHPDLLGLRSKVFIAWDPHRAIRSMALELHVGAHVTLDDAYVHTWQCVNIQDVIATIGGVPALVPLFRSMIAVGGTTASVGDGLSVLPNLLRLLAAFVHGHDENAKELLRCGGIDVIEQLLLASKRIGTPKAAVAANSSAVASATPWSSSPIPGGVVVRPTPSSLFASLCSNDWMATELVESLLVLVAATRHDTGLETKVFGRLLFNIPLWLGNTAAVTTTTTNATTGAALHLALLPALSFLAKSHPEKVRDCVGAKDMVYFIRELAMVPDDMTSSGETRAFNRFLQLEDDDVDIQDRYLCAPLTQHERRHVRRMVLGMLFEVLASGTSARDLGPLLRFVSSNVPTNDPIYYTATANPGRETSLRHQFQLEICTMLLVLLQLSPPVPGLMESFAQCCGNVQTGVGWILSVMVKPSDDALVALGIRCVFAYLKASTKSDDHPISLYASAHHLHTQHHEDSQAVSVTPDTAPKKTVTLASSTVASFAKGFASSMGPAGRASMVLFPPKVTSRVVYKLLWNLLKSHRFVLGAEVRSALLYCMSDTQDTQVNHMLSLSYMLRMLVVHGGDEKAETSGCWFSYDVAKAMLQQSGGIIFGRSIQNKLVVDAVLRLLRYLPAQTTHQWLTDLVSLLRSSRRSVALVSSLEDWQSSVFHLVSVTVEELSAAAAVEELSTDEKKGPAVPDDGGGEQSGPAGDDKVGERLDLALELYATLLGHLLREGGEKALNAVEHTASLQRICANGQVVLLLVLSALCADLFDHGTLLEVGSLTAADWKDIDLEQDSLLLKQSAKLVTDAILSNGTEGLDMAAAVKSWRSMRHLTEVVVAVVSKSGLDVVDLFSYSKHRAAAIDSLSSGLHGIRLPDARLQGTTSGQYFKMLRAVGLPSASCITATENSDDGRHEIDRLLCVTLAAQVLTLLDAFIFPDSLDTSLPASQLHGLALVRNSEPRLGASQGPLIASAIRLSFLLTSALEPCSVRMLQCVSRLRCLVQWALDLIRESSSSNSAEAKEEKIASLDRLLLAVVLHCHRALGRCAAFLSEFEPSSTMEYFGNKDAQKKHYRRLHRVTLELRDVVSTIYKGRNAVIRRSLSSEAVEKLRSSLEASARSTSRESAIKEFLSSHWVTGFQDVEIRADLSVPEQVAMDTVSLSARETEYASSGISAVERLANESTLVQADFERALDVSFEEYLDTQRKWADTENVRLLESDGDTTLRKLTEKHEIDFADLAKEATSRRFGADHRWNMIHRKVVSSWVPASHWMLAEFTDRVGRRTLLVPNRNFCSHKEAAYDAEHGGSSNEHEHQQQLAISRGDSDLTDLIRRNTEAFTISEDKMEEDEPLLQSSDGESTSELESSFDADDSVESNDNDGLPDNPEAEYYEDEWDKIDTEEIEHVDAHGDVDGWARAFAWSDNEAVVARFEPVMIVTLQTYVEGQILLTSHNLYFKSTGSEMDVMTKEPVEGPTSEGTSGEAKDRRWQLSRLTEVHGRRYLLRQQAIELFFSDCHELFLNFSRGTKERERFHAKLRSSCKLPMLWSPKSLNPRVVFRKSRLCELWRKRKITNFEYLMALNRMAGRSFNDITQYPVFPWVLADYSSETIDLRDSRVYRDLTKPIGALNADRLSQLLERFKDLELFGFPEAERFLYGSHYSSPGIVLHLLIRQEPFTTMAIALQSGRFDCPDRLFFDVAASWESCMTSTTDMKELVPEFYCLPEIFLNTNKFPFGKTQSGVNVDDVGLPRWAKGSAYEFVRIQRLALESEYVSHNLHHWIDLVFGFKQRGAEAEAAHNVFHHLSYEGSVDLDKIADEVDRAAAESHIQNFGQTPTQLLQTSPHPERYMQDECWKPLIHNVRCASQLRCHTPSKQFGNINSEFGRGPVLKLFALSDSVVAVYGDLSIGSYRWYPNYKHNRLRMDRLRPLSGRELSVARDAIKRSSLIPPDELARSDFIISSSSFAFTIGGRAREDLRRSAILPSGRLMSGSETTLASAEGSALLISCGYWDGIVKAHSAESLRILASETGGHQGPIHCMAVAYDGFMLTGGKDCTCRVWVVDHPDMAMAMLDGSVLFPTGLGGGGAPGAQGTTDRNSVLVCCHVLWGHETPVFCVDLDSDSDVAVSGSQSGLVCIHTIRCGEFIRSFSPPSLEKCCAGGGNPSGSSVEYNNSYMSVMKLALDKSGSGTMAVHMSDRGLHTYTVNGVKLASTNAGEVLQDMLLCSYGEMLITGGQAGKVLIRQMPDLHVLSVLDLSAHGPVRCLTLTPDELNPILPFLFVGNEDGSVTVVDRDPRTTSTLSMFAEGSSSLSSVTRWDNDAGDRHNHNNDIPIWQQHAFFPPTLL